MNLQFCIQEKLHSTDVALMNTLIINTIQQSVAPTKVIPDADSLCISINSKATLRQDSKLACATQQ